MERQKHVISSSRLFQALARPVGESGGKGFDKQKLVDLDQFPNLLNALIVMIFKSNIPLFIMHIHSNGR